MTINTKFDLNELAYFLSDNKIVSDKIKRIFIEENDINTKIEYELYDSYNNISEKDLFESKDELINYLIKN
jgi:hypothetical protein